MSKGYPKSQFDIVNNSQINEIQIVTPADPIPMMMATYTSDKGSEQWELLTDFNDFTKVKGGLNFVRHGQAQLSVIEALRSGGYVFAKRLVSDDATLANVTVWARVIKVGNVSYVYYHATKAEGATGMDDAIITDFKYSTEPIPYNVIVTPDAVVIDETATEGEVTDTENPEGGESEGEVKDPVPEEPTYNATSIDIPLFTLAAKGRGISNLYIRIVPEHYVSKSNTYLKYSIEISENNSVLESIVFAMNPDVILDGVNQSIESKVNNASKQVTAKVYEEGIYKLASVLSQTATTGEGDDITPLTASELLCMDIINAYDKRGITPIAGIVTENTADDTASSNWTQYKPIDIAETIRFDSAVGLPIVGGSYGTLGFDPMSNLDEYTKLLLGAWGADRKSSQFDPIIYDLDRYKIDMIFDCNYPVSVKNAIIDLIDFRGDCAFLADLTNNVYTEEDILSLKTSIMNSKFVTIYQNFFKILDPYTKKQIQVTMPYLLISKLISHFDGGAGRPFAGIANGLTFPEIIEGTINYLPVVIPGNDQKQTLVDNNINYISYYDGVPVMETMYTNDDEYSQLSYLHNILAIQEVVKKLRTRCPKTRYTFLDGSDLEKYIEDCDAVINEYKSFFKSISMTYMADEKYEANNIFYATIKVRFKNFVQEEYFKVIAIGND